MSVLLIALAVAVAPDSAGAPRAGEIPKAKAEAIIAQCGARKFETDVISDNQGKVRKAKILLCAKPGESDDQWIATLEKAGSQIAASPALSADAKAKVAGEIQTAIDVVRGKPSAGAQAGVTNGLPANQAFTLPGPPSPEVDPLSRPEPIVATVRPLPPPPPPPGISVMRAPISKPPVSKPPITISCSEGGDVAGPGECIELTSNTLLVVRADNDLNSRVSLRFIRDGDPRGGLALGMMRRGQVVRSRLPAQLCAGVVRGRVKVDTVVFDGTAAGQVADTQGPYLLRC